jgi:hypothetical protein
MCTIPTMNNALALAALAVALGHVMKVYVAAEIISLVASRGVHTAYGKHSATRIRVTADSIEDLNTLRHRCYDAVRALGCGLVKVKLTKSGKTCVSHALPNDPFFQVSFYECQFGVSYVESEGA